VIGGGESEIHYWISIADGAIDMGIGDASTADATITGPTSGRRPREERTLSGHGIHDRQGQDRGNMGMLLGLQSVLARFRRPWPRSTSVLARRPFLRHRSVECALASSRPPGSVTSLPRTELGPDLDRTPAGDDLPGRPGTELDAELDRDMPSARLQHGPDRQPHRRVREAWRGSAVHQTLQVEMVRTGHDANSTSPGDASTSSTPAHR
jgi:hypothetical protein